MVGLGTIAHMGIVPEESGVLILHSLEKYAKYGEIQENRVQNPISMIGCEDGDPPSKRVETSLPALSR